MSEPRPSAATPPPPTATAEAAGETPDADTSAPPLCKGERCSVSAGKHAGCVGEVSAVDEDGDVYVKLTNGPRVVLTHAQLRRVAPEPAPDVTQPVRTPPPPAAPPAPVTPPPVAPAAPVDLVLDVGDADTQVVGGTQTRVAADAPACSKEGADARGSCAAHESARASPDVGGCLAALSEWPEGAYAAAVGVLSEVEPAAQARARELIASTLRSDAVRSEWAIP